MLLTAPDLGGGGAGGSEVEKAVIFSSQGYLYAFPSTACMCLIIPAACTLLLFPGQGVSTGRAPHHPALLCLHLAVLGRELLLLILESRALDPTFP